MVVKLDVFCVKKGMRPESDKMAKLMIGANK